MNTHDVPMPRVIRIEPSAVCNFSCQHCPVGLKLNKSIGIMSRETFEIIFERSKHLRFKWAVLYHGGEPLLNNNLFYFIKKISQISKMVKVVCNGSLLTDEMITKILGSKLNLIDFSLDGLSPEENNRIRVGSNFERISKQIIKLLQQREKIGSKIQVYISNIQIPERLGKSAKLKKIRIPAYFKKVFGKWHKHIIIRSYYSMRWPGYPSNKHKSNRIVRNYCDSIQNVVTIRWNGDIVPCCYDLLSTKIMGNIIRTPLEKIWNNKVYRDMRQNVHDYNPPSLCFGCKVLYIEDHIYADEIKSLI